MIEGALKLGACKEIEKAKDLRSMVTLFFSPQGREFCLENNYPELEQFREIGDLDKYNIYVDKDVEVKNKNVALINSHGKLTFNNADKAYLVILMHGATAEIKASNYTVVIIEGNGAVVEKDETAVVC